MLLSKQLFKIGVVLILDGFDEIAENVESRVFDLLGEKRFRNWYIIVTSRQDKGMRVRIAVNY